MWRILRLSEVDRQSLSNTIKYGSKESDWPSGNEKVPRLMLGLQLYSFTSVHPSFLLCSQSRYPFLHEVTFVSLIHLS